MRPVAALVLDLDVALRLVEQATAPLARAGAGRLRVRVLHLAAQLRAAAGRLAIAEAAAGLDGSREGARTALVMVIETARRTGALDWNEITAICNDVAERVPRPAGDAQARLALIEGERR